MVRLIYTLLMLTGTLVVAAQNNTMIGENANADGGSYNAAMGFESMSQNGSSHYTSFFGASTGTNVSSSYFNTGFGYFSSRGATISSNTCFGTLSLTDSHNASYNTALGYAAGRSLVGDLNCAVGYMAGGHSQFKSVYLGSYCGFSPTSSFTLDGSVLIGYAAGSEVPGPANFPLSRPVFLVNAGVSLTNPLLYGLFLPLDNVISPVDPDGSQLSVNTRDTHTGHTLTVGGSTYSAGLSVQASEPRIYLNRESGGNSSLLEFTAQGASRYSVGESAGGDFYIGRTYNGTSFTNDFTIKNDNGYVGIGTVNPGMPLDVNGRIRSKDENGGVWLDNNNTALIGNNGSYFGFWTSSQGWKSLSINKSNGFTGIGTDVPQARLHIMNESQDSDGNTFIVGPTNGANLRMGYHEDYAWIQSHGQKPLYINYNLDNPLVDNTVFNKTGGTVCIGTAVAQTDMKVTVQGNAYIGNFSGAKAFDVAHLSKGFLWVEKGVLSEDLALAKVDEWGDFVFAEDYALMPLSEVEWYIASNKHLPGIPSADILKKDGMDLGEMYAAFMVKIEELTLHAIQHEQQNQEDAEEVASLSQELESTYNRIRSEVDKLRKNMTQPGNYFKRITE